MRTPPRLAALTALTSLATLALTTFPSAAAAQQTTQSGDLSVLSYNVAGLPLGLGDGDPETNTPIIGSRLGSYDIVHVQEDFNHHAALYAADDHPHRTATSGGVPFGDGLNTLSDMPFEDFERVKWDDCASGSGDCLTPKGFTFMRARLAEGVWVDLYNLHTDAGSEAADVAAREKNLAQVSAFMAEHSAGNAVIIYGDTNTRYTRGDGIAEFVAGNGLTDAWVEQIRGGDAPNEGDPALVCEDATVSANCEVVDKILYRSGDHVRLDAGQYRNDHAAFRNDAGENLSDHYPIAVDFSWSTGGDFALSDQFGGPHGDFFTDVDDLDAGDAARVLRLRGGSRVDFIGATLTDGTVLAHGGSGGTLAELTMNAGEYPVSLHVCSAQHDGRTRIFYARFTTNTGRTLATGTTTSSCVTYTAPTGWQIAGFHGRAGAELDKVGAVYTRR